MEDLREKMNRRMKRVIKGFVVVLLLIVAYVFGCMTVENAYASYYDATEDLLETIYQTNEDYFDALTETDVYYRYEYAKDNLGK